MSKNPFLPVAEFPDFPKMTPALADEALPRLLADVRAKVDALEKGGDCSWDGFVRALDEAQRPLWDAWFCVSHLISTCSTEGWRKLQEKYQGEVVLFSLRVGQSKVFFARAKELRAKVAQLPDTPMRGTRLRILDNMILSATLSGVALDGAKQARFNAIQTELQKLQNNFRDNVLDATKAYSLVLTKPSELDGLPESIRQQLAGDNDPKTGPWRVTIDDAVYTPFMKHAKNRPMREAIARARATRATEGALDNTPIISRLLALRQELAELLGFKNFAELSLAQKSAPSVAAVNAMIDELAVASKPVAAQEKAALKAFAAKAGWTEKLEAWDLDYWAERQREQLYSYSEDELSKYFNLPIVLKGLFGLANRLFGVTVEAADRAAPVWHKDVRFFRVKNETGKTIAHFYFDPYSRPGMKNGGAWADAFHAHERTADGTEHLPLALVCCNQSVPDKEGRALMRFREVETLFHEFGHALQHMLSTVDDAAASGFGLIEWDAVEIASQFMENWCVDKKTVKSFARHCETNELIPDALIARVRAAKNYRAAHASLRQLCFARTDFALHTKPPADANALKDAVFGDLLPDIFVPGDRFLNAFKHIFGGGYSAGYYGYKWSEVMSADVFGAFEEAGLDNEAEVKRLGRAYRDTFLSLGGSVDPMVVFKRFRGRAPSTKALLRQSGLIK